MSEAYKKFDRKEILSFFYIPLHKYQVIQQLSVTFTV